MINPYASLARGRLVQAALVAFTLACANLTGGCGAADIDGDPQDSEELVGTWRPSEVPSVDLAPAFNLNSALITFGGNGKWRASDGCNRVSGNYTLDAEGNFATEATRPNAGIGCHGGGQIPYSLLLAVTDHIRMQPNQTVVFVSADNKELLRLSPAK